MKHLLSILALLTTSLVLSQTIAKQIIGASGKTLTNDNLTVSYTLGETVVGLMTADGNQLGNGYHPAMDLEALNIEDSSILTHIKVYPNPTSHFLYVSHPEINSFEIQITDLNGKQLYWGAINKDEAFDLSNYSPGMYLITVKNKDFNQINTYKIIKK